jgi:hypothetical protein
MNIQITENIGHEIRDTTSEKAISEMSLQYRKTV